jgi:hypothetical protein
LDVGSTAFGASEAADGGEVDFCLSALGSLFSPSCSGGVLMSANDSGIEGIIDPDDIAVFVFLSEDLLKDPLPGTVVFPAPETIITGRFGWIALGQIFPGSAGAQDPENAIEDRTMVGPGMAGFIGMRGR